MKIKVVIQKKGIHNELPYNINYQNIFYFLSTIIILSKSKYIICNSSNCSMWIMFDNIY